MDAGFAKLPVHSADKHIKHINVASGSIEILGDIFGIPGMGFVAKVCITTLVYCLNLSGEPKWKDLKITYNFVNGIRQFTCAADITLHDVLENIPDEFNMKYRAAVFLSQSCYDIAWALDEKIIKLDVDPQAANVKELKKMEAKKRSAIIMSQRNRNRGKPRNKSMSERGSEIASEASAAMKSKFKSAMKTMSKMVKNSPNKFLQEKINLDSRKDVVERLKSKTSYHPTDVDHNKLLKEHYELELFRLSKVLKKVAYDSAVLANKFYGKHGVFVKATEVGNSGNAATLRRSLNAKKWETLVQDALQDMNKCLQVHYEIQNNYYRKTIEDNTFDPNCREAFDPHRDGLRIVIDDRLMNTGKLDLSDYYKCVAWSFNKDDKGHICHEEFNPFLTIGDWNMIPPESDVAKYGVIVEEDDDDDEQKKNIHRKRVNNYKYLKRRDMSHVCLLSIEIEQANELLKKRGFRENIQDLKNIQVATPEQEV